jgi:hypothetical protein
MRVFTRPVIGRSFPARDNGVSRPPGRSPPGGLVPGSLAPLRSPVPRVRTHIRASSWPLRFFTPEAIAAAFVSPRTGCGSHRALLRRRLAARPRSRGDWLALGDEGSMSQSPIAAATPTNAPASRVRTSRTSLRRGIGLYAYFCRNGKRFLLAACRNFVLWLRGNGTRTRISPALVFSVPP